MLCDFFKKSSVQFPTRVNLKIFDFVNISRLRGACNSVSTKEAGSASRTPARGNTGYTTHDVTWLPDKNFLNCILRVIK